jgi:hypothetical protein
MIHMTCPSNPPSTTPCAVRANTACGPILIVDFVTHDLTISECLLKPVGKPLPAPYVTMKTKNTLILTEILNIWTPTKGAMQQWQCKVRFEK